MDSKALYKLSYGLYLLTARSNGRDNGCIVDAVVQAASNPPRIAVCVMDKNLTKDFILESGRFNLSVLTESTPAAVFERFGMHSGRDMDKFESFPEHRTKNGLRYYPDANAVISCRVTDVRDLGSHTMFLGEVTDAETISEAASITYEGYRSRLKSQTHNVSSNIQINNNDKGENNMKKFVCKVCGYIYQGDAAPAECPVCHASSAMFQEVQGELTLAAEHEFGVYASTVKNNPDISAEDKQYIFEQLKANFDGECSEVGMYLCMARIAHREGYPEIGLYWEKAAYEEAEHAAKFAELLGSDLESNMTASTKKNLEWRVDCEFGATAGKVDLAKCAKKNGLDAIHDTVHEMARDEARHGKALNGLLERYFK